MALCGYYGTGYAPSVPAEGQIGITGRSYVPAGTARPVLWFHSAGAGSVPTACLEPWIGANNTLGILGLTAALGLPILSADTGGGGGAGTGHWGNDTAQARVNDMRSFAQSNAYLKASAARVILMGVSMGGMLALNWARANPALVQCVCLFYPATSLQAIHDGTGGAANGATATETAYGGSLASFNAAVVSHDPAQNAAAYAGVPMKMWRSDVDTVVGSANQAAFYSAVGGSAFQQTVLAGAAHADMTRVSAVEVASFVAPYV